ncbi:MAG: tyrosinase family protein, partial [Acidobacteriota bacterium]|nr:tyrosinase family protein [Acidobacteriota bacterium]
MAKKRKDINELSADELANYVHALDILRARSAQNPDDESGYDFQAGLHNDVFIGPCEHGNDLFLAWHRCHLHHFEKLLQESDPPRTQGVTIPYWDWLHKEAGARKFPDAFYRPGLSGQRNEASLPLPPDTLDIVTGEPDWNKFGGYPKDDPINNYGKLELGPHNYMHPQYIGGKMAFPGTAAEDPIYFSFHCFIDLLWAEWQRRNGEPPATSPDADLRGFLPKPKHKARDFQRTTDLDYEYEYTDRLKQAFEVSQPPPPPPQGLLLTERLEPLFADTVSAEMLKKSSAAFALPKLATTPTSATLRLRDLKVPVTGSYMLRAFVHPKGVPFDANSKEFEERYYVGYVSLWRAHAGGHGAHEGHGGDAGHEGHGGHGHHPQPHHPAACTVRFDVSKSIFEAGAAGASGLLLTLQYVPAPGP